MMMMMILIMMMMMMMMMIKMLMTMMMMMICFPKKNVGLLQVKPYQSDPRCFISSVQLNQGTRKVELLALKIFLDCSLFLIHFPDLIYPVHQEPICQKVSSFRPYMFSLLRVYSNLSLYPIISNFTDPIYSVHQ